MTKLLAVAGVALLGCGPGIVWDGAYDGSYEAVNVCNGGFGQVYDFTGKTWLITKQSATNSYAIDTTNGTMGILSLSVDGDVGTINQSDMPPWTAQDGDTLREHVMGGAIEYGERAFNFTISSSVSFSKYPDGWCRTEYTGRFGKR